MIETSSGNDDDRPATFRLTTTRTGNKLVTSKEMDLTMIKKWSGWFEIARYSKDDDFRSLPMSDLGREPTVRFRPIAERRYSRWQECSRQFSLSECDAGWRTRQRRVRRGKQVANVDLY